MSRASRPAARVSALTGTRFRNAIRVRDEVPTRTEEGVVGYGPHASAFTTVHNCAERRGESGVVMGMGVVASVSCCPVGGELGVIVHYEGRGRLVGVDEVAGTIGVAVAGVRAALAGYGAYLRRLRVLAGARACALVARAVAGVR